MTKKNENYMVIYGLLKGMPEKERQEVMGQVVAQVDEDERTKALAGKEDLPTPFAFCLGGDINLWHEDKGDAIDCLPNHMVVEINGIAIVTQEFAVASPVIDGEVSIRPHGGVSG